MGRACAVLGTKVLFGQNVSHANNKTARRFLPNLQTSSFFSEVLGVRIPIRLTPRGLRTLEKNGGIDAYLEKTPLHKLSPELASWKKALDRKKAAAPRA